MPQRSSVYVARDIAIVALSITLALVFAWTGVLKNFLDSNIERELLGSFLSGLFFVSIFTAAPASVALYELAQTTHPFVLALFGGLGGLVGDLLIFKFVRNNAVEDINYFLYHWKKKRRISIFEVKILKSLFPFLGALIIASPLPDEFGIALMGLTKMPTAQFVPISLSLNFLGILIIAVIAQH